MTKYKVNGKVVSRRAFLKVRKSGIPMIQDAYGEGKPLVSLAASCHRLQVNDFNRELKEAGISGVKYLPDGTCVITGGQKSRNRFLKFRGMIDQDAGYGDYAGG